MPYRAFPFVKLVVFSSNKQGMNSYDKISEIKGVKDEQKNSINRWT